MKPEKQQLIHELHEGESRRESTLLAAGKILQRRRSGRAARQILALLTVLTAGIWLAEQGHQRAVPNHAPPHQAKAPAPFQAQSLTDAQLLSLFPNTPVGLATLANGKKLLIFPRPADEARYVSRL